MKCKIGRGSGFRGVLDYALGKDAGNAAEVIGGNMTGQTARELAAEFGLSRAARPNIARPVWHASLSLPPGESLDSDRWADVVAAFMHEMGLGGHQYVVIRHHDTDLDHVHVIASRIALDGAVYHGKFDARRAIQVTQALEERFDLTRTKGLDEGPAPRRAPTQNEIERGDRTGEAPVRLRLQEIVDAALDGPQSAVAFVDRVAAAGVRAVPNLASTGRMNGFSFELDGVAMKASALGKAYGWKSLQQRGIEYEPDRDGAALRERANGGAAAAYAGGVGEPVRADGAGGDAHNERLADPGEVRRLDGGDGGDASARGGRGDEASSPGVDGSRGSDQPAGSTDRGGSSSDQRGDALDAGTEAEAVVGATSGRGDRGGDWRDHADRIFDLASPSPGDDGLAPQRDARPLTAAQRAKLSAWAQQHDALDAPAYRLTLMSRVEGLPTYVMGKGKGPGGTERTYTATEVARLIPYLSRENMLGRDVYITPMDPANHYIVVDDMTPETGAAFDAAGYRPALVQESSPGNQQAILRAPRLDTPGEQTAANLVVVGLNQRYGDASFSGVIHPFRMAGFANKKPGRNSAFTRIVRAAGGICAKTVELLAEARARIQASRGRRLAAESAQERPVAPRVLPAPQGVADARHDALRARELRFAASRGWAVNESAIDYRVARAMLAEGIEADEVAGALLRRSPAIEERHRDVSRYIDRTIAAAGRPSGRPEEATDGPLGPS